MTVTDGSKIAIRRHNRPYRGLWYLKKFKSDGVQYISFRLSHPNRCRASDPILQSGDKLIVLDVKESNKAIPGRLGWEVRALDQDLNPFDFFWDDETAFRSMWER